MEPSIDFKVIGDTPQVITQTLQENAMITQTNTDQPTNNEIFETFEEHFVDDENFIANDGKFCE